MRLEALCVHIRRTTLPERRSPNLEFRLVLYRMDLEITLHLQSLIAVPQAQLYPYIKGHICIDLAAESLNYDKFYFRKKYTTWEKKKKKQMTLNNKDEKPDNCDVSEENESVDEEEIKNDRLLKKRKKETTVIRQSKPSKTNCYTTLYVPCALGLEFLEKEVKNFKKSKICMAIIKKKHDELQSESKKETIEIPRYNFVNSDNSEIADLKREIGDLKEIVNNLNGIVEKLLTKTNDESNLERNKRKTPDHCSDESEVESEDGQDKKSQKCSNFEPEVNGHNLSKIPVSCCELDCNLEAVPPSKFCLCHATINSANSNLLT